MKLKWLNGKGWEVAEDFPYAYGVVKKGFRSDGITLKFKLLHIFIDRQGKALRAAIIHDYMYVNKVRTKRCADDAFFLQCLYDGMPRWKAYPMYWAVRFIGRGSY